MTTITRIEQHIKQRFALKVLRYYAGLRNTDPARTTGGRMGMTEARALREKEKTRDLILRAADNIRAGKDN